MEPVETSDQLEAKTFSVLPRYSTGSPNDYVSLKMDFVDPPHDTLTNSNYLRRSGESLVASGWRPCCDCPSGVATTAEVSNCYCHL
jgi:hypothetical protein